MAVGKMGKLIGGSLVLAVIVIGGYALSWSMGLLGTVPNQGAITQSAMPESDVLARQSRRLASAESLGVSQPKQILFGDFHVHTTYSADAFLWSLPMNGGTGVHPIGEACDFARFCSNLDFWSINDHAESMTKRRWDETRASMRQCQAVSGEGPNADLFSFLGFEWTQVGALPSEHYGHKNVIFQDLDDDKVSARPIASSGAAFEALRQSFPTFPVAITLIEGTDSLAYADMNAFLGEIRASAVCDPSIPSSELPLDCVEVAANPGELVARLEQQGLDPLVIPHGSTWGFYTPTGTSWDKQLKAEMRPERMNAIEIYSGHGNSEEYRSWRSVGVNDDGETYFCPEPSENYTPGCWRAGEIIEDRCLAEGTDAAECAVRATEARQAASGMSVAFHTGVEGVQSEDWLDAGQCVDCFLPAFNYRPMTSMQYGLAISNFDDGLDKPRRFNWGVIASSDTHSARPGTGYKEYQRSLSTEAGGAIHEGWRTRLFGERTEKGSKFKSRTREELTKVTGFQLTEMERQSSFWQTGGLAAVHAEGRSRKAIWDAFQRKEIFATSGPKMLLWFNLVNAGDGSETKPMGASVEQGRVPTFSVRATGSFKQKPGCPDFATEGLGADKIASICGGECDNPSDVRHMIKRIEIVRIRPQTTPGENVDGLIDDAFITHTCEPSPEGCAFEFQDPDYETLGRDTLYYARAVQEATPTINANPLQCERDGDGNCIKVNLCHGDYRTDKSDECLAPAEHRAWSSPIYLTYKPTQQAAVE